MKQVYVEIELDDDVFVKGRVSKQELDDIRKGNRGSMLLHMTSKTVIVGRHVYKNIVEVEQL